MKLKLFISVACASIPMFVGAQDTNSTPAKVTFEMTAPITRGGVNAAAGNAEAAADRAVQSDKALGASQANEARIASYKAQLQASVKDLETRKADLKKSLRALSSNLNIRGGELLVNGWGQKQDQLRETQRSLDKTQLEMLDVIAEQTAASKNSDTAKIQTLEASLETAELKVVLMVLSVKVLEQAQRQALQNVIDPNTPAPDFSQVNALIAQIDAKLLEVNAKLKTTSVAKSDKTQLQRTKELAGLAQEMYQTGIALREKGEALQAKNDTLEGTLKQAYIDIKNAENEICELNKSNAAKDVSIADLNVKIAQLQIDRTKTLAQLTDATNQLALAEQRVDGFSKLVKEAEARKQKASWFSWNPSNTNSYFLSTPSVKWEDFIASESNYSVQVSAVKKAVSTAQTELATQEQQLQKLQADLNAKSAALTMTLQTGARPPKAAETNAPAAESTK